VTLVCQQYSDPEGGESPREEKEEEGRNEKQNNANDESQAQQNQSASGKQVEFDLLSIVPEETDENQTDSQQSQDDNEQKSPGVARRMYGYPVVDPLTGRPCGVMLPVDEASAASAAAAVAEISGAVADISGPVADISGPVDDVFLQPRGGPDLFVEGAFPMEPPSQVEEPVEAISQYVVEVR